MFGKGSLIIVLGAVIIFSQYQLKLSRAVLATTDNFNYYYTRTLVHQNALSALNFGINEVWANSASDTSFNVIANACTSIVSIISVGLDSIKAQVNTHAYTFLDDYFLENNSNFKVEDSIYAYFSYQTPISRYFWFTQNEGYVYWVTGDTTWGPLHTNSILRTSGSPVFYGKITAYYGIWPNPFSWWSQAHFYGGWEIGIQIDIPTDTSPLLAAAVAGNAGAPMNTKSLYNQETTFEFLANGDVVRQVGSNPADTVALSTIAPTGVIHNTMDVRVKGVFDGQLTILSDDDIWIDDDVTYTDDPLSNPSSDDLLGLVAFDNVFVTDNAANNNDCVIHASMMAMNGKFTAQNYSTRPVAGTLTIVGSVVQKNRGPIGTFNWWTKQILSGFNKSYRYDSRLQTMSAPYYPFIRELRLVSWWE